MFGDDSTRQPSGATRGETRRASRPARRDARWSRRTRSDRCWHPPSASGCRKPAHAYVAAGRVSLLACATAAASISMPMTLSASREQHAAVAFATRSVEYASSAGQGRDEAVAMPVLVPDRASDLRQEAFAGEGEKRSQNGAWHQGSGRCAQAWARPRCLDFTLRPDVYFTPVQTASCADGFVVSTREPGGRARCSAAVHAVSH